jgi:hypothetical protein
MEKHKASEAAKTLAGLQKEANVIVTKLTPVIANILSMEAKVEFALVALPLTQPLLEKRCFMQAAVAGATVMLACTNVKDVPKCASLKEVLEAIAASKKTVALITNMLAIIARSNR